MTDDRAARAAQTVHRETMEAGNPDQRMYAQDPHGVLDWTGTTLTVDRGEAETVARLFETVTRLQDDTSSYVTGITAGLACFDVPEEEVIEYGVEVSHTGNATFFALVDDKDDGLRIEATFTRKEIARMADAPALDPDGPHSTPAPGV